MNKPRYLVVDDEKLLRENLALLISSAEDCDVYQAENAYEALEILGKYPIDMAFVDINMPGLSGIELLKLIRRDGHKIPVILMTGYPSLELTVEALREGASDFLIKPFTSQQLFEIINRFKQKKDTPKAEYNDILELLKQKTREQTLLFTISDRLTSCNSLSKLYYEIVKLNQEFISSEEAVFYLFDQERGMLVPTSWVGLKEEPQSLSIEEANPITKSVREGLPYLIPQKDTEKAALVVPFRMKEEIFGALVLCRKENFSKEDLFLATIILERSAPLVENFILYESIVLNLHDALKALVKVLEAKDPYTKEHSERVTRYAVLLAKEIGLSVEEIECLRVAGHLHDIGKVGIPDAILLKPGRLTPDEFEVIKAHPLIGAEIVGHIGLLAEEAEIIKYHHERWDGNGYPTGLAGQDIPLLSRILAVADAFDAMTSKRPYRPAMSFVQALKEIKNGKGSQFDPEIVQIFVSVFKNFLEERNNEQRDISSVTA
ncbi:response regulator receiver modulated metal dependent phosphohydrolase [Thermodesulfatator indicus DSM 15286]|uniref:Response regulator receiver modulated metal dependent phosphohydrolase n=1 Tax=Thermodesulfatator indicus (strain DSM 15286 / JCM 11887 / CIR29812) TaxID=667014 RepID=F8AAT2_THEID|nr:HD domain-containing phosphohydrolase [Thermodesulfatator indicus]AEH45443.1 response regulator receiver modulated metal dependent phosphohydrolase [Thermodesulfatator indicus DSM 15286]